MVLRLVRHEGTKQVMVEYTSYPYQVNEGTYLYATGHERPLPWVRALSDWSEWLPDLQAQRFVQVGWAAPT